VTSGSDADLRDTGAILEQAADVLDFGQPVAVMLLVHRWRPAAADPGGDRDLAIYAGVGRKA
jgi:hypothetical protein